MAVNDNRHIRSTAPHIASMKPKVKKSMPAIRTKLRKSIFCPTHVAALDCEDVKREDGMTDKNDIIVHHIAT